jgi:hypothetical protein
VKEQLRNTNLLPIDEAHTDELEIQDKGELRDKDKSVVDCFISVILLCLLSNFWSKETLSNRFLSLFSLVC